MDELNKFSAVDYVIFALMLAISAGIGLFYGCFGKNKNQSSKDMLVANRQMGLFPASLSLLASFMSGITILGTPSEVYNYGTMFLWSGVAYTLVSITTANIFIPLFLSLDVTSAYEYLEKRFDRYVKLLASLFFIVQMTVYMALVLYAPALAINQVTGLNTWYSVISIGVVCTFYTTIGGMKAVMWTDVFQIFVMLIGLLSSIIKGLIDVGGFNRVLESNLKNDRIEFWIFNPDPTLRHTIWGLTIGSFFQWLSIYGVNQSQVQRYLSVPSIKIAKKAIYWNLAGLWIILSLTIFVGMIIFAKYETCDPISNCAIKTGEQLYPFFVMDTLKSTTGLPGLFLACLFSAALSTISSGLNSLAAVTLEDVIKSFIKKDLSEKKSALWSKILCIIYGVICLIVTYLVSFLGTLLQAALSLFGVIGGPILGLFCLGLFVPFANATGAIAGTISGLAITLWIFIGANVYGIKYPKKQFFTHGCLNQTLICGSSELDHIKYEGIKAFHSISYTWYGFIAVCVVCIVGVIVSLITGPLKPDQVDSRYILPFFDKLFPCLPEKFKKILHFGYDYETDYKKNNKVSDLEMKNKLGLTVSEKNESLNNNDSTIEMERF